MHVSTSGPGDGEPVVFLHGAMVAGWMWTQQARDLAEFRCLIPDLPGFGRSGGQPWTSTEQVADQVAELISSEAGHGGAHVVGLSLGGLVAVHVAARHPRVVRSVLVSGVPYGELSRPLRLGNRALTWLYRRAWGARLVARALGLPDAESRRVFVEGAQSTHPDALQRIQVELNVGALPDLGSVSPPLLAVAGSRDSAVARRFVDALPEVLPTATAAIVPGVGHQWNAEAPELFAELVRTWITDAVVPPGMHRVRPGRTRQPPPGRRDVDRLIPPSTAPDAAE